MRPRSHVLAFVICQWGVSTLGRADGYVLTC